MSTLQTKLAAANVELTDAELQVLAKAEALLRGDAASSSLAEPRANPLLKGDDGGLDEGGNPFLKKI